MQRWSNCGGLGEHLSPTDCLERGFQSQMGKKGMAAIIQMIREWWVSGGSTELLGLGVQVGMGLGRATCLPVTRARGGGWHTVDVLGPHKCSGPLAEEGKDEQDFCSWQT
jgi:hypothetical protein